ncbi:MAG: iron-containing alcohol dehydrogenase [Actinomycetota bacterium]|nr:iron-containing alcohol dehydrogenase [Actinomycetota bacterium]
MIDFKVFFPNVVLSGECAIENIAGQVKRLNGKNVLILTDYNISKLPFMSVVEDLIKKNGFGVSIWNKVLPNPNLATVKEAIAFLNDNNCDLVVGIGGGSVLDTAKAVAVVSKNEMDIEKCLGLFNIKKRGFPLILVPTTSGTGSEATHISVLVDENTNQKVAIYSEYNMADAVIIDYRLTYDLPPNITAETGLDALTHAIEAFASKGANLLSDLFAINAIEMICGNIVNAYIKGNHDKDARKWMALGSFYAGIGFCSAGLGAAHGLAYPLIDYGLSHGRSVGIFLPWVMEYNLSFAKSKYAKISKALDKSFYAITESEAAEKSIDLIKKIIKNLGISYRLRDYGIKTKDLDDMAKNAFESSKRLLDFNPRDISLEDAQSIYKKAY